MIAADARARITADDLRLLAEGGPGGTAPLDDLLDQPELGGRLLAAALPGPSPSLLFYVLVRRAFLEAGVEDPAMADYFASLLREFGIRRRAHRVDDVDDEEHRYLVDILADLSASTGTRHFKVSVHLGNYAVWLAGIFPERVAAQQLRRGGPDLSYYEALGGRGFAEASGHELAGRRGLDAVLRTAAERIHDVRLALNRVSATLDLRSSRLAA